MVKVRFNLIDSIFSNVMVAILNIRTLQDVHSVMIYYECEGVIENPSQGSPFVIMRLAE